MPELVFCLLTTLATHREMDEYELTAASGYSRHSLVIVIGRLLELEWVSRPWAGKWAITERGKIALALDMGRRSRLRARGINSRSVRGSLKAFLGKVPRAVAA